MSEKPETIVQQYIDQGKVPISSSLSPEALAKATPAGVAMKLVHDLPHLLIIVAVCGLAFRGQMSAENTLIGVMGTLLARSWPNRSANALASLAVFAFITACALIGGCAGPSPVKDVCIDFAAHAPDGGALDAGKD